MCVCEGMKVNRSSLLCEEYEDVPGWTVPQSRVERTASVQVSATSFLYNQSKAEAARLCSHPF